MKKINMLLHLLFLSVAFDLSAASSYKLVAYWGQNGGGDEKALIEYCKDSAFDVIVIGFVNNFVNIRNKDSFPSINLSKHCGYTSNTDYPALYICPDTPAPLSVTTAIKTCQTNGKKVYISLGGAIGNYGLKDADQANTFAYRMWNLFFSGKDTEIAKVRPFGDAVLDGIDLDIEHTAYINYDGFTEFTQTLHSYMENDTSKTYYISGAPQCPYPDANMKGVLENAGHLFDEIFIQYYNNPHCSPGALGFEDNFKTWIDFTRKKNPTMKVYVGLPSHQNASGKASFFKDPKEVEGIYNFTTAFREFGGFMLWDAGFDTINQIDGYPYSKHVQVILQTGAYNPEKISATKTKDLELAAFWGSNKAYKVRAEKGIFDYCNRKSYDVIIMNTLTVFFDDANLGDPNLPGLNFARHCTGTFGPEKYPKYLNCPGMASQIRKCQAKNRKILLSVGGGSRWVGFNDKEQAEKFATNLWNLFLGGKANLRTFGSVILDGINLDIRWGKSSWFPDFLVKLRDLMNTDSSKRYLITANPLCAFPHHTLGDTFASHSQYFDNFYISFDDKGCSINSGQSFEDTLSKWFTLKGPDIYIGMPSHKEAAVDPNSYMTRTKVKEFIKKYLPVYPRIKGIVLEETSWDDLNIINGERYSDYVGAIIKPNAYAKVITTKCTSNCGGTNGKTGAGNALSADLIVTCLLAIIYITIIVRL